MSEPFVGEIRLVGFNFAPQGWALCQGQLLSIAQNAALFSLLGTTYGGDGRVTFGLPDLRGRSAVGFGQGPGLTPVSQGELLGQESLTLTSAQLPAHAHTAALPAATAAPTVSSPADAIPAAGSTSGRPSSLYAAASAADSSMAPFNTGVAGGSQPVPLRSPALGMNYIIALEGIYPSRS